MVALSNTIIRVYLQHAKWIQDTFPFLVNFDIHCELTSKQYLQANTVVMDPIAGLVTVICAAGFC
jgi:hypothetical protein